MERFLNKITCGDNCDLLGELPRECIDLVVTSPPYDDLRTYGGHSWDFYGVAWQLKRVLKPGGVIVWVVADATKDGSETCSSMEQALFFKRLGLNLHDTMIYQKENYVPLTHNRYEQAFEFMFVFSKGKPKTFNGLDIPSGKVMGGSAWFEVDGSQRARHSARGVKETKLRPNIWPFVIGQNQCGHPATFPAQLANDHVLSWSNPGEVVLDCFSGSGTTARAAKEQGRQYIGFEINPEYCTIGEARTAQEVLSFATV